MSRGPLRVFLSHSSELAGYPSGVSFVACAEEGVKRAGDAVMDMAYFTARDDRPAAYCREAVQRANVYVGVIGFRYGSPVPDRLDVSYTELEFDTAGELGLPRLVFLLDEATLLPRSVGTDHEFGARQDAFRARVKRAGVTVATVRSPQELTTSVLQALVELRVRTDARIAGGIVREGQPVERPVSRRVKFVNPPPTTAPTWFQDRHAETRLVGDFLRDEGRRLMALVGRGGAGKTTMVCRLLKALEAGRLPDDLGELAVEGIVYLAPVGTHPVTFAFLFADLCRLLPDEDARRLGVLSQDASLTPDRLMLALLEHFPTGPVVVLLDNLEDVIDPPSQTIGDADLAAALKALLTAPAHGVKVLATTRVPPADLLQEQPGRAARLDLDAGLPTPFAQDILKEMDADGALGLRDAAPELLDLARQRTRGFPRALEALVAILNANRDTTLAEVLDLAAGVLPGRIVYVLVGEAFTRLDPLAQQVMQALAVFSVPVPPVAVDFLLRPFQPAIDAAPVLSRLVNMQFARRDGGRYHLHQVDRDYALEHLPPGEPGDDWSGPAYTLAGLRQLAADYFASTRTPPETWKTLDDLTAQLAEFDLRCEGGDFDNAAPVLFEISHDCLQRWGHTRLALILHQRLHGHLTDPNDQAANHLCLGLCYDGLGQTQTAIEHHEQALAIDRETGDRQGEAADLGNLGNCYAGLGQTQTAIDHYEQALIIDREIGDRLGEGADLGNLGLCYAGLGQTQTAIDHHQQALTMRREIGYRQGEAAQLGNLGNCYADLGQTQTAIDHYEQALTIAREIGYRQGEAIQLGNLGNCYADLGQTQTAIDHYEQALTIAREIGYRQGEATHVGNLGNCYFALGQTQTAIDHYERALTVDREIGDRQGEGAHLGNLGLCYADLGQIKTAIDHYQQALTIARETGYRQGEALDLTFLGDIAVDQQRWVEATDFYHGAIQIGQEIGHAQAQAEAATGLARCLLFTGDFDGCLTAATDALDIGYPPTQAMSALLAGLSRLRAARKVEATQWFTTALAHADRQLEQTPRDYTALDVRALALCGLAITAASSDVTAGIEAFRAARQITSAAGTVVRTLRLLDQIIAAEPTATLTAAKVAASGT
jgi:tetratricopeptide (TPR) repeat protein